MTNAYTYKVTTRTAEAMLTAACLGARPRSLAVLDGAPRTLRYGTCFTYGDCWLITRTSRIAPPFWGVRAAVLDDFASVRHAVLLLDGFGCGWLLDQEAVAASRNGGWPLAADGEYKIKGAPKLGRRFECADALRELLSAYAPVHSPPVRVLRPSACLSE